MNKLFKRKGIIGKFGILIVTLSMCLGLFQGQMANVQATTSNQLPFDVSFNNKLELFDEAIYGVGKAGRTWEATVTGDGLYYGTLGIWAHTSDISTQNLNKRFDQLKEIPGIEVKESKYNADQSREELVFGVFIRNKTSAEIQDYLNNNLYIKSPDVDNGVQDFRIIDKLWRKHVNITYKADTGSNNGNGTVTVKVKDQKNDQKLEENGSMDVKLNMKMGQYTDTEVTITMTPESGSYVDGISINGVIQERYTGEGEKTYTIPNITEHIIITPSFSLAGTDITQNVDGSSRPQGNLAWVEDTSTEISYKEALTFDYNAKVQDFILNSNFGKSWTYGTESLEDPKMFMDAQFENGQPIKIGESYDKPADMGKIGGERPTRGMALNTGITAEQVTPGKFTQEVTADYYTADSICQNHWYHVAGVAYRKDALRRTITINKDTLNLTLNDKFTYGDSIIPKLEPASKGIAGSKATIDENKVQYQYVGIDGTEYNSSIAPTMPGKYKVVVTYEGDTYIQAYDANELTKEFTINKSTPNISEVETPIVTPHAEHLELTGLVDGQLYSIDGNNWYTKAQIETSNPFTQLDQNKEYIVQTKIASTDTSNESGTQGVASKTLIKLSGKVTGRDLPATLTFTSDGKEYTVETDDNGNYLLEVPSGEYTMKADGKNGDETYKSKTPISINQANTVLPDVKMERTQQGQDKDLANEFVKTNLTDENNNVVKKVNSSTVDLILGGETEFNNLNPDAQKYVNAQLTDAKPNTYQEMLKEAKKYVKDSADKFIKDNLTVADKPVTEVNKDTLDTILAAEGKYNALSQSEKNEINAQLSAAGATQTYEEMLKEAKDMLDETTNNFIQNHMTNSDGIITKVNESTLDNILGGEKDFNALTNAQKAEVNAKLKAEGATQTYGEMLEAAHKLAKDNASQFVKDNLTVADKPVTEVNKDTLDTILAAEDKFDALSQSEKDEINAQLSAAGKPVTYEEMLKEAKDMLDETTNNFIQNHMTNSDGIITKVNESTLDNILGGEKDFNALTNAQKAEVNAKLKAEGATQTYEEMLEAAHKLAKDNASQFVKDNLTDKNGNVITSVSKDTMDAILAAEDKYNALSQSEKDEINAQLSAAAGKPVTYEEMLKEAKDMLKETADGFLKIHMTDKDGIITKVNESTLDNILGGEKDFNALTNAQKAEVNAKLKAEGATQTYEEMLEAAHKLAKDNASQFVKDNLTDKNGNVITSVSKDTMDAILAAEDKYNALSQSEKDEINAQLSAAAGKPVTYEEMLKEAKDMLKETADGFLKIHMTDKDGKLITTVSPLTFDNILGGEKDFNALTNAQKAEVNAKLKAAGATQTYEEMLALAKTKVNQSANEFIKKYVSDKDGHIYKLATKDNYAQILSGEDTWNKLSQSEKDAINAILKVNDGKTYEELLKQANVIKDAVKTDDETDMTPLYMLLLSLLGGYIVIKKRKEA